MEHLSDEARGPLLDPLLKNGWTVMADRDAITKTFVFDSFVDAFTQSGGSISRVNLTISATDPSVESVPAPASLPVLLLGLCGLLVARRNTKQA